LILLEISYPPPQANRGNFSMVDLVAASPLHKKRSKVATNKGGTTRLTHDTVLKEDWKDEERYGFLKRYACKAG